MRNKFWKILIWPILTIVFCIVLLIALRQKAPEINTTQTDEFAAYRFPEMQLLELTIPENGMEKLKQRRDHAVEMGIIFGKDKKSVKGHIKEGNRTFEAKIRLKGDWTDHLEGNKWSFRISIKRGQAWRGMKKFSIQNPRTRGFLREWIFHKALLQEAVLSPRYDFIQLKLNGANLGVYAIEEHFDTPLMESQGRRAGVLVKIDETGMWEGRLKAKAFNDWIYDPLLFYSAAATQPFGKKKVLASPTLSAEFEQANKLMRQYRFGLAEPAQVFDLKKWAQFYALVDLFRAYHCLIWHNRRMYYNPILQKLEPVAYDGYSGSFQPQLMAGPFTGFACNGNTEYGNKLDLLGTTFFKDKYFVRNYYGYLQQYASADFLNSFLAVNNDGIRVRESMMRQEHWTYHFDRERLTHTAKTIQKCLGVYLNESLLTIERTAFPDGKTYICLQNTSPIAMEVWQASKGENSAKLLDAFDGQHTAEFADFMLGPEDQIFYKVPASKSYKILGE